MNNNVIRWFESVGLDAPELRSPQPCKRGIHCDYKLKAKDSEELVRACCSGVHPGEEGTGRRFFPARTLEDGRQQPACVRLTGAAQGFYERRRLRLSWAEWCEQKGIPFTPALPGQPFEPVVRVPIGGRKAQAQAQIAYSENQMDECISGGTNRLIKLPAIDGLPTEVQMLSHCSDPNCNVTVFIPIQPSSHAAPPPLNLTPISMKSSFPVSSRGGECSPDCCCPRGYSCHDRSTPSYSNGSFSPLPDGASAIPIPTTPSLSSPGINYEEND